MTLPLTTNPTADQIEKLWLDAPPSSSTHDLIRHAFQAGVDAARAEIAAAPMTADTDTEPPAAESLREILIDYVRAETGRMDERDEEVVDLLQTWFQVPRHS